MIPTSSKSKINGMLRESFPMRKKIMTATRTRESINSLK
jgi:hypothetical protein